MDREYRDGTLSYASHIVGIALSPNEVFTSIVILNEFSINVSHFT